MNPYKILGVKKKASKEEIHKAFKDLAKKHHPDINGDEEEFKKINEAYQILSNKETKMFYDSFGFSRDSKKHEHYKIVTENIKSYIESRLTNEQPIIIEEVTHSMKTLLDKHQSQIINLQKKIDYLKSSKNNVKMKKRDKVDCFQLAIDNILEDFEGNLRNLELLTKKLEKSVKIIEDYKTVVKGKRTYQLEQLSRPVKTNRIWVQYGS